MAFIKIGMDVVALKLRKDGRLTMSKGFRDSIPVEPRMNVFADKSKGLIGIQFVEDGTYSTEGVGSIISTGKSLIRQLEPGRFIFSGQEGEMFVFKKEG